MIPGSTFRALRVGAGIDKAWLAERTSLLSTAITAFEDDAADLSTRDACALLEAMRVRVAFTVNGVTITWPEPKPAGWGFGTDRTRR